MLTWSEATLIVAAFGLFFVLGAFVIVARDVVRMVRDAEERDA